jgi:hypothetical protein
MRRNNYDDMDESPEQCFVVERPVAELPTFTSQIYQWYSPISVQELIITDDISHRQYYGKCRRCSEDHYLGTLVLKCDEPVQLYARVST